MTRPDTVPAALRFDEDSAIWAGLEERTIRQLPPYGGRPEMLPPTSEDATVVERALSQIPIGAQAVSEASLLKQPEPAPPSGTRNRLSTSPPDAPPRLEDLRSTGSVVRAVPAPRSRGWLLLLAVALGVVPAYLFGKSVGDGSLERVVRRVLDGSSSHAVSTPAAVTPAPSPQPAPAAPEVSAPQVAVPNVATAPAEVPGASEVVAIAPDAAAPLPGKVPVLRFDALPLAEGAPADPVETPNAAASGERPGTKKKVRAPRR